MSDVTSGAKPTVVVLGMMGRTPFAGVGWQVLHYLEGFRRCGYEAYYVEDTDEWPYDAERETVTDDCTYTVSYIARLMRWAGFDGRWAYKAAPLDGRSLGLSDEFLACLYRRADVLVNLTGATVLREEHLRVPVRIYLETDPVAPQIEIARGKAFTIELLGAHTHHFSFGENFGAPDCGVPLSRFDYQPTRQPIVLDWWYPLCPSPAPSSAGCFTTVASWEQSHRDIEWNGERYGWSKRDEFLKFLDLPSRSPWPLELALAIGDVASRRLLETHGWRITDAVRLSTDILPYRDYLVASAGEFSVAKDQNIRLRSGWFSDRSASYLAAGRPVIAQDTAFDRVLPTGRGLFGFQTMDDILAAFDAIAGDYAGHCRAARELAHEYFAAEKVVGEMMERV